MLVNSLWWNIHRIQFLCFKPCPTQIEPCLLNYRQHRAIRRITIQSFTLGTNDWIYSLWIHHPETRRKKNLHPMRRLRNPINVNLTTFYYNIIIFKF